MISQFGKEKPLNLMMSVSKPRLSRPDCTLGSTTTPAWTKTTNAKQNESQNLSKKLPILTAENPELLIINRNTCIKTFKFSKLSSMHFCLIIIREFRQNCSQFQVAFRVCKTLCFGRNVIRKQESNSSFM